MAYPGNGWPEQPQQPPYQGNQQQPFDGGPQPPAPKKAGLWVVVGALVVVIAVGITLLIVLTGNNNGNLQAAPVSLRPGTLASSAPSSTRSANNVESTTPGRQGILSTKDNVAPDTCPASTPST
jgi:hypothetical protein